MSGSIMDEDVHKKQYSDNVYWQVADHPARDGPERLLSSRSTQLGKEDFFGLSSCGGMAVRPVPG